MKKNLTPENLKYINSIPENMKYLFENADYLLTQKDYDLLTQKHNRAKNLEKHNGAWYPGLTSSSVYHLKNAYHNQIPINKKYFDYTIERLSQINKPNKYY